MGQSQQIGKLLLLHDRNYWILNDEASQMYKYLNEDLQVIKPEISSVTSAFDCRLARISIDSGACSHL